MKILVAVKQVAALDEDFEFRDDGRDVDPDFLIRDLNEWDDFSLEEAVKIKEASTDPIEVVAVSVGPDDVDESLRKCLAKGADRAIRIWDEAIEGSDPIAIARVLAAIAKREAPDLFFAGVQSSDQSFAATGIAAAAFLDWPHAAVVCQLTHTPGTQSAVFRRELEGGLLHEIEIQCPAVLTIQLGINTPRYASLRSIKQAAAKPIEVVSLADLGLSDTDVGESRFGIARASHVCARQGAGRAHRGRCGGSSAASGSDHSRIQRRRGMSGVLVIAEQRRGELRPVSLELVSAAQGLRRGADEVSVAIVGSAPERFVPALTVAGVDEVVTVRVAATEFDPDTFEAVVGALIAQRKPDVVLVAHSVDSFGYAAALAAKLGLGFATDVFDVRRIDGELVATRGGYGQKVNVEVDFPGRNTVLLAIRTNVFKPPEPSAATVTAPTGAATSGTTAPGAALGGTPRVTAFEPPPIASRATGREFVELAAGDDVDMTGAEFILTIGRGIGEESNVAQFRELADALGATLGCSRPIADAGWLPKSRQVGQSGKTATACKLYIAMGVSGAIQHLAGMKHVSTIVAVNSDAEASIFNVAKFGIVGDIFAVSEELRKIYATRAN